jgi:protein phosphatase
MSPEMQQAFRIKFETGAATHVGRVRAANEDCLYVNPDMGVWAVADGVGGYEAGQIASQTVAESLATIGRAVSHLDQIARFKDRVLRANGRILGMAQERGAAMGSTIAALLIYDHRFSVAWSGDSRVYMLRGRNIGQITRDHTEVQELLDDGSITPEEAKNWPRRNVITRAVGVFDDPELEVTPGDVYPDDSFVICSDGLTGHVSDAEIAEICCGQRAQTACDRLIELTLERGARDNVTVVVVRCHRVEKTNFVLGGARS